MPDPTLDIDAVASTDYVIARRPSGNRLFEFRAALSNFALSTLAQTIAGVKTFSSIPVFSAGTAASNVVGGVAGGAATRHDLIVRKTGIADNTATDIITVTVPNGAVNAGIFVDIIAHLGTGTDVSESTRCATGCIVLARKTGADTVAVAATLTTDTIATTAGGGTITLAYDVSAIVGLSSVAQTFTITLTIVKTGTITDHTAVVSARLLNSGATGATMAAS